MTQQDLIDNMTRTAKGMIEDLQGYYEGKVMDPEDNRMKKEEEMEDEDEGIGLYEYLMDNYGLRYVIWADGTYDSCIITFAVGGPGIWLDTQRCEIRGHWGSDEVHVPLPDHLVELVDDEMSDVYRWRS